MFEKLKRCTGTAFFMYNEYMKPNIIALDIDGTLTDSAKQIPPKTRHILMKAQKEGCRIVLASGRTIPALRRFAEDLHLDEHHGILVAYNGGMAVDVQTGEVLFDRPLQRSQSKSVLEHMKKFNVYPMIDRGDYMYVNNVYAPPIHVDGTEFNVVEYEARGGNFLLCEVKDLAAFADFPIRKILTAGEPDYLLAHYQEMQAPFVDSLSCMFTADFYFEFTAKGVDKAAAIRAALQKISQKKLTVAAFGDSQNDISMIEMADLGVAMGNANAAVKAAADRITLSNDEEGVYETLKDYFA
jgi:Cof subfamily protein (haloacid dehalogenase superfamily)